jgi:aminoglycoside phosphotransferase (APT) family kinase protein
VDVDKARAALADFPDLAREPLQPIPGGWASWTFAVGSQWIVRFPRNAGVARSTERELRLLPALAGRLPVATPAPTHAGTCDGWPFFVYRRIPGRPLAPGDGHPAFLAELGATLGALHGLPVAGAVQLLGDEPTPDAWWAGYDELWRTVEADVLPLVAGHVRNAITAEYRRVVDRRPQFPPVLVHRDLAPEHILVDERTGRLSGLIDFEDACVGDPVIDLVTAAATFGGSPPVLAALTGDRDLGPAPGVRLAFYTWVTALHHVIHGVHHDVPDDVATGLTRLYRRFG